MTKVERAYAAEMEHLRNGGTGAIAPELRVTHREKMNSDKSKIRSIKIKIKTILKLSSEARSKVMTPYWHAKLEDIEFN